MKKGKRIPFKAGRGDTGIRDNPEYMKAWAATAIVMEQQGRRQILEGFWPQLDSTVVIERNSPDKKKNQAYVEEEATWRTKTPSKKENEQEKRLAAIEKNQESQNALVGSLSSALSKQRIQCNQVITKAGMGLDLSNKAMQTLAQHIQHTGRRDWKIRGVLSTAVY
jgi:hypothetical protein